MIRLMQRTVFDHMPRLVNNTKRIKMIDEELIKLDSLRDGK